MTVPKKVERWHNEITKVIVGLEKTSRISKQHRFHLYQMGLIGIATVLGDKTPPIVLVCLMSGRELVEAS